MPRDYKGGDVKASEFRAPLQYQRPGLPFPTRRSSTLSGPSAVSIRYLDNTNRCAQAEGQHTTEHTIVLYSSARPL